MYGWNRAAATLAGAFAAGALVWIATHVDEDTTYGYWAVYGLIAIAGLVLALVQLAAWMGWGRPRVSLRVLFLAFLPVALAGLWILAFNHPQDSWLREHARAWANDVRLGDAAAHFRDERGIAAFMIGVVLGFSFDTREGSGRPAATGDPTPAEESPPT